MPIERNIGAILVDTRPVIKTTALIDTLVDAKEFSLDTVDAVGSEGPYSVTCGGGKCAGPCVQRCLPQPPPPGRCKQI